jgi:hypothetical protein
MDYINLPPGRNRMLAYSNYLINRNRTRHRLQLSPIRNISYLPARLIYPVYYSPRIDAQPPLNYNILSSLEDVKVGLINKNLLLNSNVSINKNNSLFCVICQDNILENQIIRTLKCFHSFDLECIDNWLINNKKCPTCKCEI